MKSRTFLKSLPLAVPMILMNPVAEAGRILFIGDSHSTIPYAPFGSKMNERLRSLPKAEVSFHSRCGSTVQWWYSGTLARCGSYDQEPTGTAVGDPLGSGGPPTPNVQVMMDAFQPQLMVVQLGGNYMNAKDWAAYALSEVPRLVKDIQARSINCIWVGPPDFRLPKAPEEAGIALQKRSELIQAIRTSVEPTCTFVDSTSLTRYPETGGDGRHYSSQEGYPAGVAWAESVFELYIKPLYQE